MEQHSQGDRHTTPEEFDRLVQEQLQIIQNAAHKISSAFEAYCKDQTPTSALENKGNKGPTHRPFKRQKVDAAMRSITKCVSTVRQTWQNDRVGPEHGTVPSKSDVHLNSPKLVAAHSAPSLPPMLVSASGGLQSGIQQAVKPTNVHSQHGQPVAILTDRGIEPRSQGNSSHQANDQPAAAALLSILQLPAQAEASPKPNTHQTGAKDTGQEIVQTSTMETPTQAKPLTQQSTIQTGSREVGDELVETSASEHAQSNQLTTVHPNVFSLDEEQMGHCFVENVGKMTENLAFDGKFSIRNFTNVDFKSLMDVIQAPKRDYDLIGVQYWPTDDVPGVVQLGLSQPKPFRFPDFTRVEQAPSLQDSRDFLSKLISSPPKDPISYYVGPPLDHGPLTTKINSLLHPGLDLLNLGHIAGVNDPYWHVGEKGSGTACHREDLDFSSSNLVCYGWKLWIKIKRYHTAEFESFVRRQWETNECDQFVRHTNLLIGPERLEKEGIDFDMILAGPGDVVVTRAREYHMVVNVTANFAVSINYLPPGTPVVPQGTRFCPRCGLYALKHDNIEYVQDKATTAAKPSSRSADTRANTTNHTQPASRKAPQKRKQTARPSRASKRIRSAGGCAESTNTQQRQNKATVIRPNRKVGKSSVPSSVQDKADPCTPNPLEEIFQRTSIDQFRHLIRGKRQLTFNFSRLPDGSEEAHTWIVRRLKGIQSLKADAKLAKFIARVLEFSLEDNILATTRKNERTRADPDFLKKIRKDAGLSEAEFKKVRERGRAWKRVCGDDIGLLCFIPLHTSNVYYNVSNDHLSIFHQTKKKLGAYTTALCTAGKAFIDSLDVKAPDVEFYWESHNFEKLSIDRLGKNEIIQLLKVFPYIQENEYTLDDYPHWPRPAEWPENWPWPHNPTSLLDPSENQCDYCSRTGCTCIASICSSQKPQPQIKYFENKGRGLQAQANDPSVPAYGKGDIIGQLTGKLVPNGTYNDERTRNIVRDDLPSPNRTSTVGQIYTKEVGNCFRLLNHHCKANATFQGMRVSGMYRMMVVAVRDISHGEEITVDYERGCVSESGH